MYCTLLLQRLYTVTRVVLAQQHCCCRVFILDYSRTGPLLCLCCSVNSLMNAWVRCMNESNLIILLPCRNACSCSALLLLLHFKLTVVLLLGTTRWCCCVCPPPRRDELFCYIIFFVANFTPMKMKGAPHTLYSNWRRRRKYFKEKPSISRSEI